MKQKFTKNFFYQFVYQVLIMALPMVTVPIVSKALGSQGVGIYNYVYSVVSYFVLVAGLGLATYGIREIAAVKGDLQQLSEKFWELAIFNVISTTLTISCYIVFIFFTHYSFYYLIMGSLLVAVYFDISWFFMGIEDFKKTSISNLLVQIVTFVLIVFFI
ncbi:oligosaccharide flippase family protein, partial [Enterococcus hirae]